MPVVHFVKQNVTVECPVGTNLRELALANEIDLYAFPNNIFNCRGLALCGTCRVKVDEPRALSARTAGDERKNGWEGPQYRLACQSKVLADLAGDHQPAPRARLDEPSNVSVAAEGTLIPLIRRCASRVERSPLGRDMSCRRPARRGGCVALCRTAARRR